ncbi:MAG TPA: hypothetical protein VG736_13045 [Vicinamibacterales bacterium]|jgi:hypothetical protein|nr:hypothetical protein [Vicinamibacterales bacterium]
MPSSPDAPRPAVHPRATVIGAFVEGWRRVIRAPAIVLLVWLLTGLVAAPLAVVVGRQVDAHVASSLVADRIASGWDARWAAELASGAQGVASTLTVEILGFGGTIASLAHLIDAAPWPDAIIAASAAYVALWIFLSGGLLARYAGARAMRPLAFLATCGVFFIRFVRLAVIVGAAYWAVFRWIEPWLFGTLWVRLSRGITAEPWLLVWRGVLYTIVIAALAAISLIADIAKVRMVVEDRHSALASIGAAGRFIRRRAGRCAALYLVNIVGLLIIARLWLQIVPAASAPLWQTLLAGQVYLIARICGKLAFMASEVAFFQGELASAQYVRKPGSLAGLW